MTSPDIQSFSPQARIRSRRTAVQALYQWQMNSNAISEIIDEFLAERSELKKADKEYFCDLVKGISENTDELLGEIKPVLDRDPAQLDPVERAILLIGAYELKHHPELAWRIVVNESVELAKMFGAEQSFKYINGVMDKIARRIRDSEIRDAC